MEIILTKREFCINGKKFILYPRLECITNSIDIKNCYYELLASVNLDDELIDSKDFFRSFSNTNYFSYMVNVLSEISAHSIKLVSFNMSNGFLNSSYLDMLLEEYKSIDLALEVDEEVMLCDASIKRLSGVASYYGVNIWLDDFGIGFSNFDTVNNYKYDAIKISKELFWQFYYQDKNFLKCLLCNFKGRFSEIIVEGIDCFDKYVFCKEMNLLMQGFFFKEYSQ